MSKLNVCVLGGAGFLGSHVADELAERGHRVRVFDLNPSPWLRPNQTQIIGNILDEGALQEAFKDQNVVYNFAGLADINVAKDQPLLTAKLNILGHINALEAARDQGIKRFVYASTVYASGESGSFYRASKQCGESYLELYQERYGVDFTILRYGSLYGRRADHRNAIFRFIKSALSNSEIHYQGTGEEQREYIHVADAARLSVDILDPEFANQHLVITGHQSFRVKDIMMMIAEILKSHNQTALVFDKADIEAHYSLTPYAYKPRLGKKLTLNPFVDMGQGILDCIHEFDEGPKNLEIISTRGTHAVR